MTPTRLLRSLLPLAARPAVTAGALALLLSTAACPGTLPDAAAFLDPGDAGGTVTSPGDAAATARDAAAACPDVPTLLAQTCGAVGCHDSTTRAEGLDLASPGVASRLVGVPASEGAGLLIDPASPAKSVVYTKLLASPPFGARMPTVMPLAQATIQCVLAWVTAEASGGPVADGGSTQVADGGPGGGLDAAGKSDGGVTTGFATIRVAAGQTTAVSDSEGVMWSADTQFTGGTAAVQTPPITITGTDSAVLYNGQRYGDPGFSYAFSVPDGSYTVTMKFAELYVTGAGQRLFSIAINGATVESGFDIYATAGAMNTAVDRTYPVTVTGGTIAIVFTQGTVQFPKVDAIEISQGDGGT
jgi:Malectin domain